MKKFGYFFLIFVVFSCGDKKYEDYNESDFYEVTGVITTIGSNKDFFGEGSRTRITYDYFVNDSTYYSGYDNSAQISFMYAGFGGPVVVKVLKKDPKINFYSTGGFSKELTRDRAKILYNHIVNIYNKRVNKRNQLRREFGLPLDQYYLKDSLMLE